MRGSQTTSRPRSVSLRIRRPAPCLSDTAASATKHSLNGLSPLGLEPLDAGLDQRVVGRRKRQLVDQHALQRVAGHVDALPERLRAHQHRSAAGARSRCSKRALGLACPAPAPRSRLRRASAPRAALRPPAAARAAWSSARRCGHRAASATRRQRADRCRVRRARWAWETVAAPTSARGRRSRMGCRRAARPHPPGRWPR